MSGFFGVASKEDCIFDLFFGTDYHSHLGTRRAGMTVYHQKEGFHRAIHNIENTPFRTKFDKDLNNLSGHLGIGCISDYEPQPLLIRSHHGTYAIMTIGKIKGIEIALRSGICGKMALELSSLTVSVAPAIRGRESEPRIGGGC